MAAKPPFRRALGAAIVVGTLLATGAASFATREQWLPLVRSQVTATSQSGEPTDPTAGHDHRSSASASASIELSPRGLKNIGYEPLVIGPSDFNRTLTLPAIVVERPARSQVHVTAPLTGLVTKVYAVNGEAVGPGEPLFEMRLTHEELVKVQTDYLRSLANLEIVDRELSRLQQLGEGVIAGKRLLEQQYERQKLAAALKAEEQAMLLHGLTQAQVDMIGDTKRLFRAVTVYAPESRHEEGDCTESHLFTMQHVAIAEGEQIDVGHDLAVLSDHCTLHVEAIAFEDDAVAIRTAAQANRKVTARLLQTGGAKNLVEGLEILYIADQIDPQSRALKVYLSLPNQVAFEKSLPDGKRYLEWRYKPGQRLQIRIPVETWEKQFVVSTEAVVDEGGETFVYRQNGDHFDQVAVHVVYRDQSAIVIANDGALFPGDVIAGHGAFQMHLALKNKAGGGVDPHTGHSH